MTIDRVAELAKDYIECRAKVEELTKKLYPLSNDRVAAEVSLRHAMSKIGLASIEVDGRTVVWDEQTDEIIIEATEENS